MVMGVLGEERAISCRAKRLAALASSGTEGGIVKTSSINSAKWRIGMLSVVILAACGKSQPPAIPADSERIQEIAQSVLGAKQSASTAEQRALAGQEASGTARALAEFKASILGELSGGDPSARGKAFSVSDTAVKKPDGQSLNRLVAAMDQSIRQAGKSDATAGTSEWQEAFLAARTKRLSSLKSEIESWQGRPLLEQLSLATAMEMRIGSQPNWEIGQAGETPTLSTSTQHR